MHNIRKLFTIHCDTNAIFSKRFIGYFNNYSVIKSNLKAIYFMDIADNGRGIRIDVVRYRFKELVKK